MGYTSIFSPQSALLNIFMGVALMMTAVAAVAQCQLTITHINTDDHCLYAAEEVVWKNATGVTVTGNSIVKNIVSSGSDAGALSVNRVKNNGWATTVIDETNTDRMFGLSSAATVSTTPSFGRAQFGIFFIGNGKFTIYESGGSRGSPPGQYGDNTYRHDDVFRIWVDKGAVKYYQNSTLLYVSMATPSLPLVVDAVLNSWMPASGIRQVKVFNGSNGTFTASAPDPGDGAAYQWYLGGNPVASGVAYTNPLLQTTDVLTCVLTVGEDGCAAQGTTINSNIIRFEAVSATAFADYNVLNNGTAFTCLAATEPAVFTDRVNIETSGNDLVKTKGLPASWDAGAFSVNPVLNNGYAEAQPGQANAGIVFGLSSANAGTGDASVQFAFFMRAEGVLEIYESGVRVRGLGAYTAATKLRIEVDNNIVKYYTDNTLRYISSQAPALPLYADISINNLNGRLNDVLISNGTTGSFTVRATATGNAPVYQWKLNGADVGTGTSYNNPGIVSTDIVTCRILPGLTGCDVTTADVTIRGIPFRGTSYIAATPAAVACSETEEHVTFTDLVNVVATGNDIQKVQGADGSWDSGATSLNQVFNNGFARLTVNERNTARVFGLSSNALLATHASTSNSTIQYGIHFRTEGRFEVYELVGAVYTLRGDFGSFDAGDQFKIRIDNGVVRYYRNDVLFYSSPVDPTPFLPMVVDLSLSTLTAAQAATLDDIVVSNGSSGIFTAITSNNMGASPVYQWKVNGNDQGMNSPTFSSGTLSPGQIITCLVRPDIAGCSVSSYESNAIRVNFIGGPSSPVTVWNGSSSPAWSLAGNWSNGVPRGYHKVVIPAGMPNSPAVDFASAAVYDLNIDPGASLSIPAAGTLTVYNDWSNHGALNVGAGTVNFKTCTGNRNNIISVAPETFPHVVIDNANGVDVTGEHHIAGQMTLLSGIVRYTGTADLIVFDDGASVTGAKNASHINGKVRKAGNEAFTFPIGKNGLYRMLAISAPANSSDHFTAEYFLGNAKLLSPPYGTAKHASFWTVSGCEYWTLERSGTSDVNVELSWNLATNCPNPPYITQVSGLAVSYWDGSIWNTAGHGVASGDHSNGSLTSSIPITHYAAFTLASTTVDNPLPIELAGFEAKTVTNGIALQWNTLTELNSDRFVIERSSTGLHFTGIDSVPAAGRSMVKLQYRYLDRQPFSGKNYYRLKSVDFDQSFKYSELVFADAGNEVPLRVYPNPAVRGTRVYFTRPQQKITVVDTLYREVMSVSHTPGWIDTAALPPGLYLLKTDNSHLRLIVH